MTIEKLNKSYTVFSDSNEKIGTFQLDSDNLYYFWINDNTPGCWSAYDLSEIAKLLDNINKQI